MFSSNACCYDNPCTCGQEYEHMSEKEIEDLIKTLNRVLEEKRKKN
jgi:hypothetical protein